MLGRTYTRIIALFAQNKGYMNYDTLKNEGVTILQLRELEENGILERFARGWYWCNDCGYVKPRDHRYIEVSLVDQEAVFCLDSACYLAGVKVSEPDTVKFAVPREDRRKFSFDFPAKRYFYTHMEAEYITTKITEFGTYRYFAPERAVSDCLRETDKIEAENLSAIKTYASGHSIRVEEYRRFIRELKQKQRLQKQQAE